MEEVVDQEVGAAAVTSGESSPVRSGVGKGQIPGIQHRPEHECAPGKHREKWE